LCLGYIRSTHHIVPSSIHTLPDILTHLMYIFSHILGE
jgi:hypothetical protein